MLPVFGSGSSSKENYKIERSLRFNSADSAYLNMTPVAAGDRRTWTWSGWVKRAALGTSQAIFGANTALVVDGGIYFGTNNTIGVSINGNTYNKTTVAVFRDVGAWYHIVVAVDTRQATAANRIRIYVNGVEQVQYTAANSGLPPQNYEFTQINTATSHTLGRLSGYNQDYTNAYLTEVHFVDGVALTPSEFGETDPITGVWRPKEYVYERPALNVEYLVIAGGGGGAQVAGGGGAGGYRSNISGELSGGGTAAESTITILQNTSYTIQVGSGGAGANYPNYTTNGVDSIFSTITSIGGGRSVASGWPSPGGNGVTGGSGGGSWGGATVGAGTAGQGFSGGVGNGCAGGGGGAGAAGSPGSATGNGGAGGNGVSSLITGSAVTRAGGGGGARSGTTTTNGAGGLGGGGAAGAPGVAGTANTGGGGGAGEYRAAGNYSSGANGGSGIVILRLPAAYKVTVSAGLTYSESAIGSSKIVQFTAGTGTVSFS